MSSELDLLMQNARLRDELEPFWDDSVVAIDLERMTTDLENQYLSSLLAWERAPVLPICQWFQPELIMPAPDRLSEDELRMQMHQVIGRLYEQNVLLECTGHLADLQLYCLIMRDILQAQEKHVGTPDSVLRWQCYDPVEDEETWLRFYASIDERNAWSDETGLRLPPIERLPFPRRMPQDQSK